MLPPEDGREVNLLTRALPIKRRMLIGVEVIGIECPDMWQQRLGKAASFDLVVGERPLQVLVQRPQRAVAINLRELAVLINDVAVADDGEHAARLGALRD